MRSRPFVIVLLMLAALACLAIVLYTAGDKSSQEQNICGRVNADGSITNFDCDVLK